MLNYLVLAIGLVFATQGALAKSASEKYQFRASEIKRAAIHNAYGNVSIAPVSGEIAYVHLQKMKWGERCKLEVDLKGSNLVVNIDDSGWLLDQECRVDMIISLPKEVEMAVQSGTGDITILANQSRVNVKVGSGLIHLKGDLLQLSALSGSGDIKLDGSADTANLRTGSGDIELDYKTSPKKGSLAVVTGSGDVQVMLPETAKLKSQISTGNGTVINEFSQSASSSELNINASSESGDIQIRKR